MICSRWFARLSVVAVLLALVAAGLIAASAGAAAAQDAGHEYLERGPRFLLEATPAPIRLDVARTPMLRRRISLDLRGQPLGNALKAVAEASRIQLSFSKWAVPTDRIVQLHADNLTVAAALTELLIDANVDVLFSRDGRAALVRRDDSERGALRAAGTLTGHVTDANTGEPVIGARVTLEGTQYGANTADSGEYVIQTVAEGTYTVSARRLGYVRTSRQVTVVSGGEAVVDFRLVPTPRMLDQIVTTATGDQEQRQVGNLIATIAADSVVATAPVTNLTELLAGRVAGVQVQFSGGIIGLSSPINIRGQNSFSLSNEPLLVVDGVRVDNSTAGGAIPPTYAGPNSGRFNDIDPSEIESIEIVKGPSAATLYGTDAANGVILVKTKRGSTGPPQWNAFVEGAMLTFDRDRFPTSYFPWGHAAAAPSTPIRCILLSVYAGTCVQDSISDFSPLRDAETTPIGTGSTRRLGAQVRGGTSIRYLLSATWQEETGYLEMPSSDKPLLEAQAGRALTDDELRPNSNEKYSVRGNFTVPFGEKADVVISTAVSHADLRMPEPTLLIYGGAGTGIRDANDGWSFAGRASDAFVRRNHEEVTHLTGGMTGNWRPTDWITARLTAGLDLSTDYVDRLRRAGFGFSTLNIRGSRENTKINVALQTLDAGLSATRSLLPSLSSRTSVGTQYSRRTTLTNTAGAQYLLPGTETVAGGATLTTSEGTIENIVAGAYLEQMIGWRDRLYLTGAVRVDGASSFGAGFDAAVYPKGSLSWIVSDEPFWPRIPGMNSFRLRAAYGESGVQPGPVAALASESLFQAYTSGGAVTGARLGEVGNPDLRPERQREFESGLDVDFLDGRFGLQATYYDKRSSDALVSIALPSSFGGGAQWRNVGAVRNRGYEALVHALLLDRPSLRWSVTLNGAINDNTVLAISPSVDAIYHSGTTVPSLVSGYPLKSYFDYPIESYSDADHDGIITASEVNVGDEPRFAGAGYPRTQVTGMMDVGLFHDVLRIGAAVEHRGGYKILNIPESIRCGFGSCTGTTFRDASFARQAANVARLTPSLHSTFWGYFEDGSFTRLRELSLTYALPTSLLQRLGFDAASVTLSGRNLALWSAYSGTDPEIKTVPGNDNYAATYDQSGVPTPTYWLLRVNIGF
jgi:TonB-linked SusC/RagA family outer membrane protein